MIIPNYFQEPDDLIPLVEAYKFERKLAAAFEDGSVFQNGHLPGCSDYGIGDQFSLVIFFRAHMPHHLV